MKRFVISLFAFAVLSASAVTATKEYVDRQDGATLQAAKDYTDAHGGGGGGGVNSNEVERIANVAVETNAVTVGLSSSVSGLQSSVSGLQSSKLDGPTDTTLAQSGKAADALKVKQALAGKLSSTSPDENFEIKWDTSVEPNNLNINAGEVHFERSVFFDGSSSGNSAEFAGSIMIGGKQVTAPNNDGQMATTDDIPAPYTPTAADPVFSNAVLSVATGISTNDWAVIASVADWASVIPGGVPTGAGTLGAVLAALAAAVLALKKKTSLLKSDGTAEDDFATDFLEKQVAINAMHYALYSVPTSGADANKLKDRAVNAFTFSGGSLPTFPAQVAGYARDFLMLISSTYAGEVTLWQGITTVGDTITLASGKDYLIAATEIAVDKFYLRSIEIGNTPTA